MIINVRTFFKPQAAIPIALAFMLTGCGNGALNPFTSKAIVNGQVVAEPVYITRIGDRFNEAEFRSRPRVVDQYTVTTIEGATSQQLIDAGCTPNGRTSRNVRKWICPRHVNPHRIGRVVYSRNAPY